MKRRSGQRVTLLAWALAACAHLLAERVELRYAPREGSQFRLTETTERRTVATDREPVSDILTRVSRIAVRRSGTGFANSATVQSVTLSRNGRAVPSPVYSAMAGLELVYRLKGNGRLVGITGYETLRNSLLKRLPGPVGETLAPMLQPDALRRRDEDAYRRVYADLPGSTFAIGEARPGAAIRALPFGGSTLLYSIDLLERPDGEAGPLRLTRRFHSDAESLAQGFEGIDAGALLTAATPIRQQAASETPAAQVEGTAITLLNLDGLLIAQQTETLAFAMPSDRTEGEAVPTRVREVRKYVAKEVRGHQPAPAVR